MISPIVGLGFAFAGLLVGALPAMIHALAPVWSQTFEWDAVQRDRFLRRRFLLPIIVMLPVAGWLADAWGPKDVTIIGLIAITAGLAALALVPLATTVAGNVLGVGVGVAFLSVGLIGWIPDALAEPHRAVEAMNLGFIPISLGWLVSPAITNRCLSTLGLRNTLLAGSAAAFLTLLLLAGVYTDEPAIAATPSVLNDLRFWLLLLALALYFPVESCLEIWSVPFLRDLGERRPGFLRSRIIGFWCAYLLARVATFAMIRTGMEPWFLLVCTTLSAMILGNLAGAYGPSSGVIGYLLVGFCYGPLLPGFLGLMAETFPGRFGLILGVLIAGGCIYHVLLGPLLSRYALSRTPREAMRMPVLLTLLLAAPLLLVTLLR